MSYIYHGTSDLIALPGRTVQTYPSGLVRVERSFVCRKADVATYRDQIKVGDEMPLDDGAPAIDGLYIFPNPQEILRPDGFAEFRVTAYGRSNTTGQRVRSFPRTSVFRFYVSYNVPNTAYDPNITSTPQTVSTSGIREYYYDQFDANFRFCIPANERIPVPTDIREIGGSFVEGTDIDLFTQSFSAAEIFPRLNSDFAPSTAARRSPGLQTSPYGFQRTNFGKFDEIFVSYSVGALDINFGTFSNVGSAPAGNQIINSVQATFNGAVIGLSRALFSTGITVEIGGETVSLAYDSSAAGGTFRVRFFGPTIVITGLDDNTVYTVKIAAFNANGSGGSASASFKTSIAGEYTGGSA
jgi:hypothetical protein